MRLYTPQSDDENQLIAAWLGSELKVTFSPPYIALASVDYRGTIIGAVVLNEFDGNNISLTGAGEGAFTPSVVRGIARYVFAQLKCARVTLRTRRSNFKARNVLKKHFKMEIALRHWFGDEDAIQFRMCRDECPWLGERHGIEPIASCAA